MKSVVYYVSLVIDVHCTVNLSQISSFLMGYCVYIHRAKITGYFQKGMLPIIIMSWCIISVLFNLLCDETIIPEVGEDPAQTVQEEIYPTTV